MSEALLMLKPYLARGSYEKKGKAVVGTVAGDFHDIGKNIVKIMLGAAATKSSIWAWT